MNSKWIGSVETMVASSVVLPLVPPVTRLPGDTRRSPIGPSTGARKSVNSRSSSACRTAASFAVTDALAMRSLCALLEHLVGDGLVTHERLPARIVGFRESHVRLRLHQICARLVERVLERPFVDREKQIALFDDLPVLETHLSR